jgi:hypothetical protein
MGLAGSAHCGAMCGPIAASVTVTGRKRRLLLAIALNTGRLLTYALAGALVGGLAGALGDMTAMHRVFAGLRGAAGVLLVGMGLSMALGRRAFAALDHLGAPVWRLVRPVAQRLSGPSTPGRALALGALWGLLPCGLVYVALGVAAVSGSALSGAATMLAFGSGTAPTLVLIGSLAARVRMFIARPAVRAVVGLSVAASGVFNVVLVAPVALYGTSHEHACCATRESR